MIERPQPITAYITSAPTGPTPSRLCIYRGTVFLPDGTMIEDREIGRPVWGSWPDPIRVTPLRPGSKVFGLVTGGDEEWYYLEIPHFGPCAQQPPGGGG